MMLRFDFVSWIVRHAKAPDCPESSPARAFAGGYGATNRAVNGVWRTANDTCPGLRVQGHLARSV